MIFFLDREEIFGRVRWPAQFSGPVVASHEHRVEIIGNVSNFTDLPPRTDLSGAGHSSLAALSLPTCDDLVLRHTEFVPETCPLGDVELALTVARRRVSLLVAARSQLPICCQCCTQDAAFCRTLQFDISYFPCLFAYIGQLRIKWPQVRILQGAPLFSPNRVAQDSKPGHRRPSREEKGDFRTPADGRAAERPKA